jgi:hypothetical protein
MFLIIYRPAYFSTGPTVTQGKKEKISEGKRKMGGEERMRLIIVCRQVTSLLSSSF